MFGYFSEIATTSFSYIFSRFCLFVSQGMNIDCTILFVFILEAICVGMLLFSLEMMWMLQGGIISILTDCLLLNFK